MNIFLHRDDLRIHDNIGLKEALSDNETLPVFVEDPRLIERTGQNKHSFRREGLIKLKQKYSSEGSDLLYKQGKTAEQVEEISKRHEISKLYYNRSYTPLKRNIERELKNLNVKVRSFKDRLLVEPRELDQEYGTFSPFYREWKKKDKRAPVSPNLDNLATIETGEINKVGSESKLPEAGEDAALEAWNDFRDNRLKFYKKRRDDVGKPKAVSRLSMYYSSGMLSLRKVLFDVESLIQESDDSAAIKNYAKYRNELAWREFFYQVLYFNPSTVEENYREIENEIEWRNDVSELEAWKKGKTGVPFVDAGIRELRETGYMHNRTRQNVASFLTKHLMIDWREGARFFREWLVDHDTASNIGGWQWTASTGTDSVSIRIFNPVKQGRRYDPKAKYIKRYIPELSEMSPENIHGWVEMPPDKRSNLNTDYPEPVINFNQRYNMGKKMFENALGK